MLSGEAGTVSDKSLGLDNLGTTVWVQKRLAHPFTECVYGLLLNMASVALQYDNTRLEKHAIPLWGVFPAWLFQVLFCGSAMSWLEYE